MGASGCGTLRAATALDSLWHLDSINQGDLKAAATEPPPSVNPITKHVCIDLHCRISLHCPNNITESIWSCFPFTLLLHHTYSIRYHTHFYNSTSNSWPRLTLLRQRTAIARTDKLLAAASAASCRRLTLNQHQEPITNSLLRCNNFLSHVETLFAHSRLAICETLRNMVNDFADTDCTQLDRSEWSWSTCIENNFQELQALVVCFRSKKVLLKKEGDLWVLPGLLYSRADFSSAFEPVYIIPDVQYLIDSDAPLVLLRQLWRRVRSTKIDGCLREFEKSVVLLEFSEEINISNTSNVVTCNHNDLRWIPADQAVVFHQVDEAAAVIVNELRFIADEIQPENRQSWQQPGWFQMAASWMINRLSSNCDATLTDDIIQLRSSHLGAILKAETTKGRFFLKCTSDAGNDAAFTQTLARLSPSYVKWPVAVDTEKQLLLTADYGEILNPFDFSAEERCCLTSCYAQFQIDAMDNVEELLLAGFPDMRVCRLLEHVDVLDRSSVFQSLQKFDETGLNEVQFFQTRKQEIKAELTKLEGSLNLRATVTHNDIWSSNIYWNQDAGNYMFFDFVDSYISHPFAFLMGGLNEKQYLTEWSAKTGMSLQELEQLLDPGFRCHLLAVLVLRVQEARDVEFPESEGSLEEAFRALRLFNRSMQRCLRVDG